VIKKEDPEGKFVRGRDLSSLRYLFLAGAIPPWPSVR
jgi:hypothetical protein